ncbi:dTDP-4-dehydrorhamnose reductase [Pseudomonas sp. G.S.17]|uniref:dTDP-4-dehydrorhamnose reductase n=1 Tax=Pseudomonas sp. G.S.17 TaxID=3137451 RepID=UPI00311CD9AB
MRILLLGKNGQVGWELQRSLAPLGNLIALDSRSLDHCGDLSNLEGLRSTVRRVKPDVIVNAAAYTSVDQAENEPDLAYQINAEAVSVLAQEALGLGALLVHYSTDYVFAGEGEKAWMEQDPVAPLNIYGASKLKGETAIQTSGCKHLIFRTSWVYAARGNNFAKTILHLAKTRKTLSIVDDQTGAPTGAELLADVTAHAIRSVFRQPELGGLYHLAAAGETSWFGYARFVLEQAQAFGAKHNIAANELTAVSTAAYPTPAARPRNSRLNTQKLESAFALHLPDWQTGLVRMVKETLERAL